MVSKIKDVQRSQNISLWAFVDNLIMITMRKEQCGKFVIVVTKILSCFCFFTGMICYCMLNRNTVPYMVDGRIKS